MNHLPDIEFKHYNAKKQNIKGKYFTIVDFNKFTSDILDGKVKQKELVGKCHLNTKAELKADQDKKWEYKRIV